MKKWMMIALVALFATAMNSQAWWIFGKKAAAPAQDEAPAAADKAEKAPACEKKTADKGACCAKMTAEEKAACQEKCATKKAECKAGKKAKCEAKQAEQRPEQYLRAQYQRGCQINGTLCDHRHDEDFRLDPRAFRRDFRAECALDQRAAGRPCATGLRRWRGGNPR